WSIIDTHFPAPISGGVAHQTMNFLRLNSVLGKPNVPHMEQALGQSPGTTYRDFARELGISVSTLFRLEQAQQSIAFGKLKGFMGRLEFELTGMFPPGHEGFQRTFAPSLFPP